MRCLSLLFLLLAHLGCLLAQPSLTSYTYWYNNQVNQAVTTPVSGPVFDQQVSLSTASLTPGLHTLHFFATDATGKRSAVESRYFFKNDNLKIARYEYWFDNQPGQAKVKNINPPQVESEFEVDLDGLASARGLSVFHIRFQDTRGAWSPVMSRFFMNNGTGNRIVAYKYWFDTNSALAQVVALPTPLAVFDDQIDLIAGTPNGQTRTVHFQFLDELGRWGAVYSSGPFLQNGTNQLPSWVRFENVLFHQSEANLQQPRQLWQGLIGGPATGPLKICADGSKATRVILKNRFGIPSTQIRFQTKSSISGSQGVDFAGTFNLNDYSIQSDTISAFFTHPTYYSGSGLFRNDTILIFNSANNGILAKFPIAVYRAPVLLVHGLWDSPETFDEMAQFLKGSGKYTSEMVLQANYETTNDHFISENTTVIPDHIDRMMLGLRYSQFSTGKVDVVGHSMGGLITRSYLERYAACAGSQRNNCYRNDIHKLITIGTPHSGSQLANMVGANSNSKAAVDVLFSIFKKKGSTFKGAIDDLKVDSDFIMGLNGQNPLESKVPSHVISTQKYFTQGLENEWSTAILLLLFPKKTLLSLTFDIALTALFDGDESDLIVARASQEGGLSQQRITHYPNIGHLGQLGATVIRQQVLTLLDGNPNTNQFSSNGFNPPQLYYVFKQDPFDFPVSSAGVGTIEVTSPSDSVISPGSSISLDVHSTGDVEQVFFCIVTQQGIYELSRDSVLSFNRNFLVPDSVYGPLRAFAAGYDSLGIIALDTLDFWVEPQGVITSLEIEPSELYLAAGRLGGYQVFGNYSDGTRREITHLGNYQVTIEDQAIIAESTSGSFRGLATGKTRFYVQSGPNSVGAVAEVGDGIQFTSPPLLADPKAAPFLSLTPSLTLIPNPNSGTFRLSGENPIAGPATLQVLAPDGRLICRQQVEWLPAGRFEHKVTLPPTPEGLYLLTLTTAHRSFSGKVVLKDQ